MFHQNLTTLREASNFSRKEMAGKLGITVQAYSQYETGKRTPDIHTIIKIADLFHVSIDMMTGRKFNEEDKNRKIYLVDITDLDHKDIEELDNMVDYIHYKAKKNRKND